MQGRFTVKTPAVLVLVLLVYFASAAFAGDRSWIAVASMGKTPPSLVSSVAAGCPYFLIFDSKGKFVEALDNPHRGASGGAGSLVVEFLSRRGATVIIASAFGRDMVGAMKAKGMNYLEFKGSAADAVGKALCGEFTMCPIF